MNYEENVQNVHITAILTCDMYYMSLGTLFLLVFYSLLISLTLMFIWSRMFILFYLLFVFDALCHRHRWIRNERIYYKSVFHVIWFSPHPTRSLSYSKMKPCVECTLSQCISLKTSVGIHLKSNAFSMTASFVFSWLCGGALLQTEAMWKHTCNKNTEKKGLF